MDLSSFLDIKYFVSKQGHLDACTQPGQIVALLIQTVSNIAFLSAEPLTEPPNQNSESLKLHNELQTPRKAMAKFLPTLTRPELDIWPLNTAYIFVRE